MKSRSHVLCVVAGGDSRTDALDLVRQIYSILYLLEIMVLFTLVMIFQSE